MKLDSEKGISANPIVKQGVSASPKKQARGKCKPHHEEGGMCKPHHEEGGKCKPIQHIQQHIIQTIYFIKKGGVKCNLITMHALVESGMWRVEGGK
jgi:hypothetical protein